MATSLINLLPKNVRHLAEAEGDDTLKVLLKGLDELFSEIEKGRSLYEVMMLPEFSSGAWLDFLGQYVGLHRQADGEYRGTGLDPTWGDPHKRAVVQWFWGWLSKKGTEAGLREAYSAWLSWREESYSELIGVRENESNFEVEPVSVEALSFSRPGVPTLAGVRPGTFSYAHQYSAHPSANITGSRSEYLEPLDRDQRRLTRSWRRRAIVKQPMLPRYTGSGKPGTHNDPFTQRLKDVPRWKWDTPYSSFVLTAEPHIYQHQGSRQDPRALDAHLLLEPITWNETVKGIEQISPHALPARTRLALYTEPISTLERTPEFLFQPKKIDKVLSTKFFGIVNGHEWSRRYAYPKVGSYLVKTNVDREVVIDPIPHSVLGHRYKYIGAAQPTPENPRTETYYENLISLPAYSRLRFGGSYVVSSQVIETIEELDDYYPPRLIAPAAFAKMQEPLTVDRTPAQVYAEGRLVTQEISTKYVLNVPYSRVQWYGFFPDKEREQRIQDAVSVSRTLLVPYERTFYGGSYRKVAVETEQVSTLATDRSPLRWGASYSRIWANPFRFDTRSNGDIVRAKYQAQTAITFSVSRLEEDPHRYPLPSGVLSQLQLQAGTDIEEISRDRSSARFVQFLKCKVVKTLVEAYEGAAAYIDYLRSDKGEGSPSVYFAYNRRWATWWDRYQVPPGTILGRPIVTTQVVPAVIWGQGTPIEKTRVVSTGLPVGSFRFFPMAAHPYGAPGRTYNDRSTVTEEKYNACLDYSVPGEIAPPSVVIRKPINEEEQIVKRTFSTNRYLATASSWTPTKTVTTPVILRRFRWGDLYITPPEIRYKGTTLSISGIGTVINDISGVTSRNNLRDLLASARPLARLYSPNVISPIGEEIFGSTEVIPIDATVFSKRPQYTTPYGANYTYRYVPSPKEVELRTKTWHWASPWATRAVYTDTFPASEPFQTSALHRFDFFDSGDAIDLPGLYYDINSLNKDPQSLIFANSFYFIPFDVGVMSISENCAIDGVPASAAYNSYTGEWLTEAEATAAVRRSPLTLTHLPYFYIDDEDVFEGQRLAGVTPAVNPNIDDAGYLLHANLAGQVSVHSPLPYDFGLFKDVRMPVSGRMSYPWDRLTGDPIGRLDIDFRTATPWRDLQSKNYVAKVFPVGLEFNDMLSLPNYSVLPGSTHRPSVYSTYQIDTATVPSFEQKQTVLDPRHSASGYSVPMRYSQRLQSVALRPWPYFKLKEVVKRTVNKESDLILQILNEAMHSNPDIRRIPICGVGKTWNQRILRLGDYKQIESDSPLVAVELRKSKDDLKRMLIAENWVCAIASPEFGLVKTKPRNFYVENWQRVSDTEESAELVMSFAVILGSNLNERFDIKATSISVCFSNSLDSPSFEGVEYQLFPEPVYIPHGIVLHRRYTVMFNSSSSPVLA